MRYKILILSALILGSLCSVASSGGCGKWVARAPSYDFLQDPIMDMNDPLLNETDSVSSEGQSTGTSIPSQLASARVNAAPKPDLSGKWSFRLNGTDVSSDMILIQSASWAEEDKDRIQGYGDLLENNLTTPLTATGSLSNDTLDLELKPSATSGKIKLNKKYILQMALSQGNLIGSYEIYSYDVLDGKGSAIAYRLGA